MDTPTLVLVDKPRGITSFDVIRILRRRYHTERAVRQEHDFAHTGIDMIQHAPKMGHAGTLDPLASGLMLIGVGDGTKKLNEYLKLSKTYEATILLGERRSTGDMEGDVLEEKAVMALAEEDVNAALCSMEGTLQLPVPVYSAVKQNGVPLYMRARQGRNVVVPIKPMVVECARVTAIRVEQGRAYVSVTFDVGSGTYIRSLAEELGKRLGYPATLYALRRTRIGTFHIEDAKCLEETGLLYFA